MKTKFRAAIALALFAASSGPAFADYYQDVGKGLYQQIRDPAYKEAMNAMKEQDAREAADRAEAKADARRAASDRQQRDDYQRRNANPRGPL